MAGHWTPTHSDSRQACRKHIQKQHNTRHARKPGADGKRLPRLINYPSGAVEPCVSYIACLPPFMQQSQERGRARWSESGGPTSSISPAPSPSSPSSWTTGIASSPPAASSTSPTRQRHARGPVGLSQLLRAGALASGGWAANLPSVYIFVDLRQAP